MPRKSSRERAEALQRRKEKGLPRRGDREAGYGKDKHGPKGGRNAGGRGRERERDRSD